MGLRRRGCHPATLEREAFDRFREEVPTAVGDRELDGIRLLLGVRGARDGRPCEGDRKRLRLGNAGKEPGELRGCGGRHGFRPDRKARLEVGLAGHAGLLAFQPSHPGAQGVVARRDGVGKGKGNEQVDDTLVGEDGAGILLDAEGRGPLDVSGRDAMGEFPFEGGGLAAKAALAWVEPIGVPMLRHGEPDGCEDTGARRRRLMVQKQGRPCFGLGIRDVGRDQSHGPRQPSGQQGDHVSMPVQ